MKIIKPKKRLMFYWILEKGFFFLIFFFLSVSSFIFFTDYQITALYFYELSIFIFLFSIIIVLFNYVKTEYILLNNNLCIKNSKGAILINYSNIKTIKKTKNLIQILTTTTGFKIKTKDNKVYYLLGVRNKKEINKLLIKKVI